MDKVFEYTPNAKASFDCQEYMFKRANIRDAQYDFNVNNVLDGFNPQMLLHNRVDGGLPWYATKGIYLFLSLLFLGWIQRIIFTANSRRVTFLFRKLII